MHRLNLLHRNMYDLLIEMTYDKVNDSDKPNGDKQVQAARFKFYNVCWCLLS